MSRACGWALDTEVGTAVVFGFAGCGLDAFPGVGHAGRNPPKGDAAELSGAGRKGRKIENA